MRSYIRVVLITAQAAVLFMLLLGAALLIVLFRTHHNDPLIIVAAGIMVLVFALWPRFIKILAGFRFEARLEKWMKACSPELEGWVGALSSPQRYAAIAVTAGLTLFFELVLIRWESGIFQVFALYKNFTLLACFCGLGLGYAMVKNNRLVLPACLPVLVLLLLILTVLRYGSGNLASNFLQVVPVREEGVVGVIGMQGMNFISFLIYSLPVYFLLAIAFLLNALTLIPVGQFCGYIMQRVQPLAGYGWNLAGSAGGVILLFFLSYAWTGPVIWFGVIAAVVGFYLLAAASARRVALICMAACIVIVGWPVEPLLHTIYSPYQVIQTAAQGSGLMKILASGVYYQKVYDINLANANRESDPVLRKVVGYYDLPFKVTVGLDQVAVVGAGSGNDIAAALRNGAKSVDAVEIDPAIRDLGREAHPEHPYQDARVHSVINDARNFFRETEKQYDAIIYGVLDSHIMLSHGGNVRVDSFVYTKEGLQNSFDHLKPGGLMSVSFALSDTLMGQKIFDILQTLPGAGAPAAILNGYDLALTTTFMVRRGAAIQLPEKFMAAYQLTDVTPDYARRSGERLDLPTDDWPFFYMNKKAYPATYVVSLILMLGLTLLLVRSLLPGTKWESSLLPFFFLGGGFMLVETKAVTELGLLFGNTWQVVGIAIMSVLLMAYMSNAVVAWLKTIAAGRACIGVLAMIALGYVVASHHAFPAVTILGKCVSIVLLAIPLFFSGLVFSALLKDTKNISGAMAYNLIGAMLGGMLEYNSMQFGFLSLYLIAFALYALAWLTIRRRAQGSP